MALRSGKTEGVPYSLSRWTDVPAAKWGWFSNALDQGRMEAFEQATGVPDWWSLDPADTLALIFWTKDPSNLLAHRSRLDPYTVKVHVTATGWHEVERGAPDLNESKRLLIATARAFGPDNVTWRFSPVPYLLDGPAEVLSRFWQLAEAAEAAGIRTVFLSFLQTNDLLPEPRSAASRAALLLNLAERAENFGLDLRLCQADALLQASLNVPPATLRPGVCVPPEFEGVRTEACGCMLMADPFTINESCTMGCLYCYAADVGLSNKKRNTTRHLPVIR